MESRKEKIIAFFKSYCIIIWIVVAAVVLTTTATLAAYKYQQYAKMVARNSAGGGIQFSSDILEQEDFSDDKLNYTAYNSAIRYSDYSKEENASDPVIEFNVCNYPQNSSSSYNKLDITYSVWAKVVNIGNTQLDINGKVSLAKKGGESVTFDNTALESQGSTEKEIFSSEQLLTINRNTFNTYQITVDKGIAENVQIVVEVRPNDSSLSATSHKMLSRIFQFAEYSNVSTKWSGSFKETSSSETYWGYNYELSGSDVATIILAWDESKITLGNWWINYLKTELNAKEYTGDKIASGYKALTFKVGDNGVNSYTLQFYLAEENQNGVPQNSWVSVITDENDTETENEIE